MMHPLTNETGSCGVRAPNVYRTCLAYNHDAELHVLTERTWQEDENGPLGDITTLRIDEFRGRGRARYLTRQRDPERNTAAVPASDRM